MAIVSKEGELIEGFNSPDYDHELMTEAFAEETRALTLALSIQYELGLSLPIYSDCQSVLKVNAKAGNATTCRQWEYSSECGPLFSMCGLLRRVLPRDPVFSWIKAHPERWKNHREFTPIEKGNVIADQIAGGKDPHLHNVDAGRILDGVTRLDGKWVLYDSGGPSGLNHKIKIYLRLLTDYLSDRSERYDVPYHQGALEHAMNCNISVKGKKRLTLSQRGARLKLILSRFDKDRVDRSRTAVPLGVPRCKCGCPDTLLAWMTICRDGNTSIHRGQSRAKISSMGRTYRHLLPILTEAMDTEEQFWRGNSIWLWNRLTEFFNNRSTTSSVRKEVEVFLDRLTDTVLTASLEMHTIRREAPAQGQVHMHRRQKEGYDKGARVRRQLHVRPIETYFIMPCKTDELREPEREVHLDPQTLSIPACRIHPMLYKTRTGPKQMHARKVNTTTNINSSSSNTSSSSSDSSSSNSSSERDSDFQGDSSPTTRQVETRGHQQWMRGGFEVQPTELDAFSSRGNEVQHVPTPPPQRKKRKRGPIIDSNSDDSDIGTDRSAALIGPHIVHQVSSRGIKRRREDTSRVHRRSAVSRWNTPEPPPLQEMRVTMIENTKRRRREATSTMSMHQGWVQPQGGEGMGGSPAGLQQQVHSCQSNFGMDGSSNSNSSSSSSSSSSNSGWSSNGGGVLSGSVRGVSHAGATKERDVLLQRESYS